MLLKKNLGVDLQKLCIRSAPPVPTKNIFFIFFLGGGIRTYLIVFFKEISDFGVSRLFKELSGQYSRCSRIASFCRRDLKKNWKYFNKSLLLKKFFENQKNQFWKIDVNFF